MSESRLFCVVCGVCCASCACCASDKTTLDGTSPAGLPACSFGVAADGPVVSCVTMLASGWFSSNSRPPAAELGVAAGSTRATVFVPARTTVFVSTLITFGTLEVRTTLVGVDGPTMVLSTSVSSKPVAVGSSGLSRPPQTLGLAKHSSGMLLRSSDGVSNAPSLVWPMDMVAVAFTGVSISGKSKS